MQKSFRFVYGLIFLFLVTLLAASLFQNVEADVDAETAVSSSLPDFIGPTTLTSGSNESVRPALAVAPDGSSLIVAYSRAQSGSNHDIYYRKSTDNGSNFTAANPIINTDADSSDVDIAFDASTDRAHIVWVESAYGTDPNPHLYYARENANGSWSITSDLEFYTADNISDPKIYASGSQTLDVVWLQRNLNTPSISGDIYHARSENRGGSWFGKIPIDNDDTIVASLPDLYANGNTIHVVWVEQRQFDATGRYIVYTKGTWNTGTKTASWSDPVDISYFDATSPVVSEAPRITEHDGTMHVIFTEKALDGGGSANKEEQYVHHVSCSSSCTSQSNWDVDGTVSSQRVSASDNSPEFVQSTIAAMDNCILVYYHGIEFQGSGNELIWGNSSCNGSSWSTNEKLLSTNQQMLRPDMAVHDDTFVYLAYERQISGVYQIQFMRTEPIIYLPIITK